MRKTFMNIAVAIEERKKLKASLSKKTEQRSRWMKALVSVVCVGCLGLAAFWLIGPLVLKRTPVVRTVSELKWGEVEPGSKDFAQPADAASEIFDATAKDGLNGLSRVVSRNIPSEIAEEFVGTMNLFKGGALTVQTVRKKNDDPAGRYEVFCKSSANGHRLKLQLVSENGALRLAGAGMVP